MFSSFSLVSHSKGEALLKRAGFLSSIVLLITLKTGQGDALRKRKALFAYFLSPLGQKVRRLAGRDPSVLSLIQKSNKDNRLTICYPNFKETTCHEKDKPRITCGACQQSGSRLLPAPFLRQSEPCKTNQSLIFRLG